MINAKQNSDGGAALNTFYNEQRVLDGEPNARAGDGFYVWIK